MQGQMHVHSYAHVICGEKSMNEVINGVAADRLPVSWRKSRYSNPNGNCVEVATLRNGEIAAFILGAKDGEFDDLIA
jgi:hypothetical protein